MAKTLLLDGNSLRVVEDSGQPRETLEESVTRILVFHMKVREWLRDEQYAAFKPTKHAYPHRQ
jgi:hypothetical protein